MNWVRADPDNPHLPAYDVYLPNSRIALNYVRPQVDADFISLTLLNAKGIMVGEWRAYQPDLGESENDADWLLLKSLFDEVYRQVTGWDQVVRDIEQALAREDRIGASH